jgi:spermidine synthase
MNVKRDLEPGQRGLILLAMALVSGAGLAFEITLTRVFSLFFQYHFAFLAVSLAVLGLSLGAAAGYFVTRQRAQTLAGVLIALGIAFPAAAIVMAWLPSAGSIVPRALAALVPFVLSGLFSSLVFERFSGVSGAVYAADLAGASVGVIVVLGLLNVMSPFSVVLLLGSLTGVAAVLVAAADGSLRADRQLAGGVGAVVVIGAALFVANLAAGVIEFDPARLKDAPRDKTMLLILDDSAQDARITRTAWSPFARVDVVETNDPTAKYIFSDGGAGSYMLRYDGTPESAASWRGTVDDVPFALNADRTLVIGAGGGKDVVLALMAGAQDVTAVEVNPAVVQVTRDDAAYNGGILDLPQVRLVEGDARTFAERDENTYDLIYLNLVYTQAAEPGSQVLVENYIFTWQAFETYLERLAPGGHIAIISHNALEASRAALTAIRALDEMGTPPAEALDHMVMWMLPAEDATLRTTALVVGKEALTPDALDAVSASARSMGLQALFLPGVQELGFEPLRSGTSLDAFIDEDAAYNLEPTGDDSPYFFHLDQGLPDPVQSALVTALFLAGGLAMFALLMGAPENSRDSVWAWGGMMLYAALIGVGFMLVEVPLIQHFQLLLGYPVVALAAVLFTLLLSGGAGSLLSQRWTALQLPARVTVAGLWIAGVALLYRVAVSSVADALLPQPLIVRVVAVMILTALVGVPMGIPFPSLMRRAGQIRQRVALLWAVNGAFSVLGSVLAVVLSMTWGFGLALTVGALLYLGMAALARPMLTSA